MMVLKLKIKKWIKIFVSKRYEKEISRVSQLETSYVFFICCLSMFRIYK